MLLAEILVELRASGRPWRLLVCGDGRLREDLEQRLAELGVAEHAEVRGYVPYGPALAAAYRESHALLHVSWTEGFPQVILEGFAAGLPVVATDVGGVSAVAEGAARLVEPGNASLPARELDRIVSDPELRTELVEAGLERVRGSTRERVLARLAGFLAGHLVP